MTADFWPTRQFRLATSAYLAVEFPESSDYESLGGLLIHAGRSRVPAIGTQIAAFGIAFLVRDARREAHLEGRDRSRPGNPSEPAPALPGTRASQVPAAGLSEGGGNPTVPQIASAAT